MSFYLLSSAPIERTQFDPPEVDAVNKTSKYRILTFFVTATVALSLALTGIAQAQTSSAYNPVTVTSDGNSYQIQLISATYNSADNSQNWTYSIKCLFGKSASHIVIEFTQAGEPPISAIKTAGFGAKQSGDSWEIMPYGHPDPPTGKSGIKYEFSDGIDPGGTRQVWFTLSGVWPTGTVNLWTKAGTSVIENVVGGPDSVGLTVPEVWGPTAAIASAFAAFAVLNVIRRRKTNQPKPLSAEA
jgi:hypothetical protein